MSRLSIRSTCKTAVAAPLILTLLAGVPFADGLLLHDHSDHGVHSHRVMLDDLPEELVLRYEIDDGFLDCFDGCDCHRIWVFDVNQAGEVTLVSFEEFGQPWCDF